MSNERNRKDGSAGNYACAPCKAKGTRTPAVSRPRIEGRNVAVCAPCLLALTGKRYAERTGVESVGTADPAALDAWRTEGLRAAWGSVTADEWQRAHASSRSRGIAGVMAQEGIADAILDTFATNLVADCAHAFPTPVADTLARGDLRYDGRTVTRRDVLNAATRAHANVVRGRELAHDFGTSDPAMMAALGDSLGARRTDVPSSWRPDVLDLLDSYERGVLLAYAESADPDPDVTPQVRAAAFSYVLAKRTADAYAA